MKLLAIDTSTEACSVALWNEGECFFRYEVAPRIHNQRIFPMIESLLAEMDLRLTDLHAIAFGRGPGSFTGVRIATSTAQGLAFALELPVIPVSTLQAIAQGAWRRHSVKTVGVAIDARMQEVYWGCYACDEKSIMVPIINEQVVAPEDIITPLECIVLGAGSGWGVYKESLITRLHYPLTRIDADCFPHAQDIAYLAAHAYAENNTVSPELALPIYLRDKVTHS